MKAAIVAIEDRRFYQHQGVDWQGTIRAVVANSASGDVVQGASTLTQQYVKNYLLYVEAKTEAERLKATEQTPARKLREARIALQLERSLSKEDILDRYLNIVFWGNGAYGVAPRPRDTTSTRPPDQLTVAQAALLAGMVRSTTQFDPVTHPDAALQRRNLVIQQMLLQGMIDQAQAQQALAEPLGIANPLGTVQERLHRSGRRRVLLQVRHGLPGPGRTPDGADPARRVHDPHHVGPRPSWRR